MTQPAKRIPTWLTVDVLVIVISLAIIGIGIGASVGFSALPMDISVMPSRTWTRPFDAAHPILF